MIGVFYIDSGCFYLICSILCVSNHGSLWLQMVCFNDVCASVNNLYFRAVFFCHFLCVSMPCVSSVCHFRFPTVCFNSLDRFSIGTDGTDGASKSWWPRQHSRWSWRWSCLQLIDQNDQPMIMMLVMAQTNWSPECAAQKWILISSCLTPRQMLLSTKTYDQKSASN